MATALVIGGSGFIGRSTARALQARGWRAVVGDIAQSPDGIDSVRTDITDLANLCRVLTRVEPDVVINLAYLLPGSDANDDLYRVLEVNIRGAQNVFEACSILGVRRCVYASSIQVYGDQGQYGERAVSESDFGRPVMLYGYHKMLNEATAMEYQTRFGLSTIGLRLSSVYGPGRVAGKGLRIADVLAPVVRGEPGSIPFPADAEFDFIHVDDVGDAFATLASAPSPKHEVYNSGGEFTTVEQLVRLIHELVPGAVVHTQTTGDNPLVHISRVDWSRLRNEFAITRRSLRAQLADYIETLRPSAGVR